MDDLRRMLDRHAEWQRRRTELSWPEKIRAAEAVRETVVRLRRTRPIPPAAPPPARPERRTDDA